MARLPEPELDSTNSEWWHATSRGVLLIQTCNECGNHQHYPRPFCIGCGLSSLSWTEASGLGTIHSWTLIRRAPYEDLKAPYVLALVDLDENVRLLTHLVGCGSDQIVCEAQVELRWIKAPGANLFQLPVFTIR
jgi:uncharacterized protein